MKKKRLVLAGLLVVLMASVAYGALLTYYGRIRATVDVQQSVLVDGKDYTNIIEDVIPEVAPGGEAFCFKHNLTNLASVDADVSFDTDILPDAEGVYVDYYELLGWSDIIEVGRENYAGDEVDLDNATDPYATLGNILIDVSYENGEEAWVVFTVTTPEGLIGSTPENYSGSVVFILDEDADGTTDWQVSYEPGSLMFDFVGVWGYEEALETGVNPEPRAFEDATSRTDIQVARDGDQFILKVDFEKLGGCGGSYKFGLYISHLTEYWGGIEGGAGQVMMFYPVFVDFDWASTSNYPTRTVGTLVTDGITVPSRGTVLFCILYAFDIAIKPGTYTITTKVLPA